MIPGIVAAQLLNVIAATEDASLLSMDFVAGLYTVGGATVSIATILDHPEWITANGLEIRFAHESSVGDGIAQLEGLALDVMLAADWTAVLEFEIINVSPSGEVLITVSSAGPTWADIVYFSISGGTLFATEDNNSSTKRSYVAGAPALGTHRIAFTRTDAKLHSSIDGAAVVFDAGELASPGFVAAFATFGGFEGDFIGNELNIRSLTVYPVQDDAALPGLSAI